MTKSRPPQAGVSHKHRARAEREALLRQWVLWVTGGIVAIIVAIVGYAAIDQFLIQPRQPVAKVGAAEITTADFQKAVKYRRIQVINQLVQYQQIIELFGNDPNTTGPYQQQLQQLQQQLSDPNTMGRQVLDSLIEDEILKQEAATRGLTIPQEEVDKAVQEAFGYYANGTPAPEPTATFPPTQTPAPTLTSTAGPLPTPTATGTPTPTLEPTFTPTSGPSPTPLPSATPYTLEGYQKFYGDVTQRYNSLAGYTEADFRRNFELNLLREKLVKEIGVGVTGDTTEANARHILVADETIAKEIIKQIQDGADFAKMAAQYSTDTSSKDRGGDLGTFAPGRMVPEFDAVVFSADIGLYPAPVKTQFGYHVIEILSREGRPLAESELQQKQQEEFDKWLRDKKADTTYVTEYDIWQLRVPTRPSGEDVQNSYPTSTPEPATAVPSATP